MSDFQLKRLVAQGNYSRIGIARVNFNDAGDPCGVERLGLTGVMILEIQTVLMCTTEWLTVVSAWLD